MADIHLPATLPPLFGDLPRRLDVDAGTVDEAIERLDERWPGLRDRLCEPGPVLRHHINVYVDRERGEPRDAARRALAGRRDRRDQRRLTPASGGVGLRSALPLRLTYVAPRSPTSAICVGAIDLARRSRERGNHPFGSLLVGPDDTVVLEAENTVVSERDVTGHAELNLVRAASARLDAPALGSHTLYASTEPCAMCAGAIYWSGIGRVVFALTSAAFLARVQAEGGASLDISCRDVFSRGGRTVESAGRCSRTRHGRLTTGSGAGADR